MCVSLDSFVHFVYKPTCSFCVLSMLYSERSIITLERRPCFPISESRFSVLIKPPAHDGSTSMEVFGHSKNENVSIVSYLFSEIIISARFACNPARQECKLLCFVCNPRLDVIVSIYKTQCWDGEGESLILFVERQFFSPR